jgi:hypothetical protein
MSGGTDGLELLAIVHEDVPRLIFIVVVDRLRGFNDDWALAFCLNHLHDPFSFIIGLSEYFSSVFADGLSVVPQD